METAFLSIFYKLPRAKRPKCFDDTTRLCDDLSSQVIGFDLSVDSPLTEQEQPVGDSPRCSQEELRGKVLAHPAGEFQLPCRKLA